MIPTRDVGIVSVFKRNTTGSYNLLGNGTKSIYDIETSDNLGKSVAISSDGTYVFGSSDRYTVKFKIYDDTPSIDNGIYPQNIYEITDEIISVNTRGNTLLYKDKIARIEILKI